MLDDIIDAVIATLKSEGLNAFREFPERRSDLKTGVSMSVGINSCRYLSSGMGEYLGTRAGVGGVGDTELFGKRLELELRFEIFSPFGAAFGALDCVQSVDRLRSCFEKLPSGLKVLDMKSGELSADEKLCAYRCICTLSALAFMVAESDGNESEFLDFVLKGTVKSGK
ncbi:MAG: hypothetical protein KBI01_07905 [Oscillospiraceae bacterium]|nr:hypothetical protein [Oscillospiraceae bacterium]